MVASFDSSRRSRRRRSVTSRTQHAHAHRPCRRRAAGSPAARSDVSPALDLLGDRAAARGWRRRPRPGRSPSRARWRPDVYEWMPEAVHRAHRVGAGEPDPQVGIEEDHAVADARGVLELVVVLAEREAALGDHRREALERRQVVLLELAEVAPEGRDGVSRVTTATTSRRGAPGCTARGHARSTRAAATSPSPPRRCGRRATRGAAPPRRRPRPRGPSGSTVWPVVGRTWASTTERLPSSPTTGASSRRSEKQRSDSACHDAASRWT